MKKIITFLSFIGLSFFASQQVVLANTPTVSKLVQEREVKNFNGIVVGGPINLVVDLGNTEKLRFEGDEDAIATLVVEVKGNVLIIRPKTSWRSWSSIYYNKKITAYVTAKTLKSLTLSGSGNIQVNDLLSQSEFTATISGSGNISAKIKASSFTGIISGSGNLNIAGNANKADVNISGSGTFGKKEFIAEKLNAKISGSGTINATVKNHINALISGSGDINYNGDPSVDKKVIGSGKVQKM